MLGVKSIVFPICAIICVLALCYKLWDFRRQRSDPALLSLITAFACKGVSFTVSTPAVSEAVDSHTGVPNLGALIIHLCGGVASSTAILISIVHWTYPPEEARRRAYHRLAVTSLCAAVMLTLWLSAGSDSAGRSKHYLLQNADRPLVAAYLLVYVGTFGAGMIEIVRVCRRYGRTAGRRWLRRGLNVSAAGAGAYLVYCLNRASAVVAVQLGLEPLQWEWLTPASNIVGISLLAAGLTMPSWGPKVSTFPHQARNFITYRKLLPLWLALYEINPSIALDPRSAGHLKRLIPNDISYRLYRQVIEIQDGLLALQPYLSEKKTSRPEEPAIRAAAHRERLDIRVLAAVLKETPGDGGRGSLDGDHRKGGGPIKDEYVAEVAWLLRVSGAYSTLQKGRLKK